VDGSLEIKWRGVKCHQKWNIPFKGCNVLSQRVLQPQKVAQHPRKTHDKVTRVVSQEWTTHSNNVKIMCRGYKVKCSLQRVQHFILQVQNRLQKVQSPLEKVSRSPQKVPVCLYKVWCPKNNPKTSLISEMTSIKHVGSLLKVLQRTKVHILAKYILQRGAQATHCSHQFGGM